MKRFFISASWLLSVMFMAASLQAQQYSALEPLPSFGFNGDGSLRPGDKPYVTVGNFQRGLSYNPQSGYLVFIDRQAGGGGTNAITGAIYVLDGLSGAEIQTLSTNGMEGGNFADLAVGVADDGVVYVGNLVNPGNTPFKLYRWDEDTTISDPVVVYSGDPGNGKAQRWGDTMDIRGAGTTTQIILGSRTAGTNVGTNVAILTTTDGTNFTAQTLTTDVADNATGGGIAFGAGNTFWAKNAGVPLRQFSFDLVAGTATTIRSYGPDVFASSSTLEPLAVDVANNLLGTVDMRTGVDQVRLYDISDLNRGPVLLDIRDFPVDNANGTTTKGYLDFGSDFGTPLLFVHNMNNGLMGFSIPQTGMPAPTIRSQPQPQRVLAGRTVRLEVLAYPAATYQWQRNGVDVPGATGSVLQLQNAQTSQAGTYRVLVSNATGTTQSDAVLVNIINPEDLYHLSPLWTATPAAGSYVTSTGGAGTPNERSIGFNALSNQLYVVQRSGNNYTVHVIDGSTGTKLYNLKTNGILPVVASEVAGANGIGLVAIDVAADGAIYACNASPNAGGGVNPFATNKLLRVYRWENSDSNTLPVQIFSGDPAAQTSNFRWGDALVARGSGLDTQVMMDNQNTSSRYLAILRPVDGTMTEFYSSYYFQDTATPFGTSIGRTLEFGNGDIVWQKRRSAPLLESSFDPNTTIGISPVLNTYSNFPGTLGPVGLDLSRNLAAGINFVGTATAPDQLALYDLSDAANPLLLAQYNFPANPRVANNNSIGRVLFSGNRVFALNGNNGLLAFTVVSGPVTPPGILQQPRDIRIVEGGSGALSVTTADIAGYQWQFNSNNIPDATNSSYMISNAEAADAGFYHVIVSNEAGSTTSTVATVTVVPGEDFHHLAPLWSVAPLSRDYLRRDTDGQGRTPLYRSLAYNSLSNQIVLVARSGQSAGLTVQVLDASTGADLYQLNTGPISGGNIILLAIAVAEDGAVYAANMDTSETTRTAVYNLYRWENSDPNTVPTVVFSGEPSGSTDPQRWGDTLAVRGAGVNTEVLIDANSGAVAALLRPTDATMTVFSSTAFPSLYSSGTIGRSLEFGGGNTFWQKRKGARLQKSAFDAGAQTASILTNYQNFPDSLGPVALDASRNLLAGINFSANTNAPDTLDLYDTSDFNNPLLIAGYPFPINSQPNGNFIGQVIFAGDRVWAVDGNNGIVAFTITPPGGPPLSIELAGSNVTISWEAPSTGFVLQKSATLAPGNWVNVTTEPQVQNGRNVIVENASNGTQFYRLCNGCP